MRYFEIKVAIFFFIALIFTSVMSCKRESQDETISSTNPIINIDNLKTPDGFNYQTTRLNSVKVLVLNADGNVYNNAIVYIMDNSFELGGRILAKGITNFKGEWETKVEVPLSLASLVINTSAINIPNDVIINNNEVINEVLGGKNFNPKTVNNPKIIGKGSFGKAPGKISTKLGNWNIISGKPNYLEPLNDVISTAFLNSITSFLPSRVNLTTRYPNMLDDNFYRRNIITTNLCDVYITFVKEGAGQRNVLFYYTYNINNPPTSVSQIDSLIIIYPNTSFTGSGGDLTTGNKVKIGRFGADTVISFGIIADGYNNTNGSLYNLGTRTVFYGNKAFNPEISDQYRQHLVFVFEPTTQRFVLGFEDVNRNPSGTSDNDFEDVIYYASVNNINNVNLDKIALIPGSSDTDGDGIDDVNDDYPNDASKAFNNYFPSAKKTATVAYEDLWYFKGDYDMNDVVMDMQTNAITNANNKLVRFESRYCLRASGGSLKTAFAIQYPIARTKIMNIVGGTVEGDKTNATVRLYDDVRQQQQAWNTSPLVGYGDSVNFEFSFDVNDIIDISSFGIGLHDPFIWINESGKGRSYEIHLPGKNPTSTSSYPFLGLGDDDTQLLGTKKYLSKNNLPWAILIPERFDYPFEQQNITSAYLNFATWAQSSGSIYKDWYSNNLGYRNNSKIYVKP
ncbi:MAG: LruC domain-containing protein [Bacteroidia bacterium]|nr:LruC domain-containing protein [Bacteroidia bacterium]